MSLVIEITINTRANPADPTFVVAGILTIVLNVKTGQFTGDITPGAVCPLDPQSTECPQQTAVLFDVVNGSIVPHEEVTQLKVEGQILRRAVNMIVRDVGGTGRHIFALGTTENDPGDQFESDVGRVAGPAVGPEAGEGGDWQIAEVRGLTRQVGNEIDE